MAFDLKMEIFAFKLFHKHWQNCQMLENEPDLFEIYGDECANDSSYLEACDELFFRALRNRGKLMEEIYIPGLFIDDIKKFTSVYEVADYILNRCNYELIFNYLNVFERMLATCEFVIRTCFFIHHENRKIKNVLTYSHIFWVICFEMHTKEFYKEGGWKKFKLVAKSYDFYLDLVKIFGVNSMLYILKPLHEAVTNYEHFKTVLLHHESQMRKYQQKFCVAAVWIKMRIDNFYLYAIVNLNFKKMVTVYEAIISLERSKYFCYPSLFYEHLDPEIIPENDQKSSLFGQAGYSDYNRGINDTIRHECFNRLETENQIKHEYLISCKDKVSFDTAKKTENILFDKNPENELLQHNTAGVGIVESSHNRQNSSSNLAVPSQVEASQKLQKIEDTTITTLDEKNYSRNVEKQSEFPVVSEVFFTNQKGEYECSRETAQGRFCNLTDIKESSGIEIAQYHAPDLKITENSQHKQNKLNNLTMYQESKGSQELPKISLNEKNCLRKVGDQCEFGVISEVCSISQKGGNEYKEEAVPDNQRKIRSLNESANGESKNENCKELLEVDINSENADIKNFNKSSINQLTAFNCDGTSYNALPKPKQFSVSDQCANNDDKIEKKSKNREVLNIERNDPEIRKLLRLILVLGDKQRVKPACGTLCDKQRVKPACGTLCDNKECAMNLQEKSNKKKTFKNKKFRK